MTSHKRDPILLGVMSSRDDAGTGKCLGSVETVGYLTEGACASLDHGVF